LAPPKFFVKILGGRSVIQIQLENLSRWRWWDGSSL